MKFLADCDGQERRKRIRFLKKITAAGAKLVQSAEDLHGPWMLVSQNGFSGNAWPNDLVAQGLTTGVLDIGPDGMCRINDSGRSVLRRVLSGAEDFAGQHREIAFKSAREADNSSEKSRSSGLRVNLSESPLTRLAARKTKDGRPMLRPEEVRAGERLRADYTFAAMMPTFGQGWRTERSHAQGGQGSASDPHDDVLCARQRVERTLTSIEPVLAGVLVDVCCHLKGLEKVEAERGWPARCAKIVLQIGLSALADRYGERTEAAASTGRIRSQNSW